MMPPEIETIQTDALLTRAHALARENWRLVQISATRFPEHFEVTYSFDLERRLLNLRLIVAAETPVLPSISPAFWCAFLYENEIHDLFGIKVENMAVDFKGALYRTKVKFPFGRARQPVRAVDTASKAAASAAAQKQPVTT